MAHFQGFLELLEDRNGSKSAQVAKNTGLSIPNGLGFILENSFWTISRQCFGPTMGSKRPKIICLSIPSGLGAPKNVLLDPFWSAGFCAWWCYCFRVPPRTEPKTPRPSLTLDLSQ